MPISPIDTSNFSSSQVTPPNALQMVGQYQGISNAMQQNQLLQQNVQQARIATQQAQGQQKVAQIIGDNTDENGRTDWLKVKSDAAKDPLAAMNMDAVNKVADPQLALTDFGIIPAGQQGAGTKLQKPLNQVQQLTSGAGGNSTVVNSVPAGYNENQQFNQQYAQNAVANAKAAQTEGAVLDNISGLVEKGADTGTILGKTYEYLAQHNLATPGIENKADQLQAIHAHAAQLMTADMPETDKKLFTSQLANVSEDQLPGTLKNMLPFLKATKSDMPLAEANYYRSQDPTLSNPDKLTKAIGEFQNTATPLLFQYNRMTTPQAKEDFAASHPEIIPLLGKGGKFDKLKAMKILPTDSQ